VGAKLGPMPYSKKKKKKKKLEFGGEGENTKFAGY